MEFISDSRPTGSRTGWYFQQLLKLYSGTYIPDILDRYLVLDSDVFFLRPTRFINDSNKPMYCFSNEHHAPYFRHMARLHPSLRRVSENYSGIAHHMMFDKQHLKGLFEMVEQHHGTHLFLEWFIVYINPDDEAYLYNDKKVNSGSSEYEMYFNYMSAFHSEDMEIRNLKWANLADWGEKEGHAPIVVDECIAKYSNEDYDYIAIHNYN
jgi:hypothetical protein